MIGLGYYGKGEKEKVAIPSNRVNVSYKEEKFKQVKEQISRNPLKSGQCFLH